MTGVCVGLSAVCVRMLAVLVYQVCVCVCVCVRARARERAHVRKNDCVCLSVVREGC